MKNTDAAIKKAIFEMLKKFNNRLNKNQMEAEHKLSSWAEYLAFERKFTVTQVGYALESLMRNETKFMPSAYEISAALKPKEISSEDIGNFIANEIIEKVGSFGRYRLGEAFAALSEPAKKVVGKNTYLLQEIADCDRDAIPTIRAQIRGLAKAASEAHRAEKKNEYLERIGIKTNQSDALGVGKLMALNFDGFTLKEDSND